MNELHAAMLLTRSVGLLLGARPAGKTGWRARGRPHEGAPLECESSVRAIPLRKSGAAGLCWLLRPA